MQGSAIQSTSLAFGKFREETHELEDHTPRSQRRKHCMLQSDANPSPRQEYSEPDENERYDQIVLPSTLERTWLRQSLIEHFELEDPRNKKRLIDVIVLCV